jgi:hypothetical protein
MAPLFRALLVAASIVMVTAQWSFSDGSLAVGPKGKQATSSFSYATLSKNVAHGIDLMRVLLLKRQWKSLDPMYFT